MAIKFLSNESIDGTLEVGSFTVSGSGIVAAVGMTLQVDAGGVNAITIDNVGTVTTSGYLKIPNYLFHDGNTDTFLQFGTDTITLRGDSGITLDGPVTTNAAFNLTGGIITLGVADTSSGHINAYENLTFNIDIDNDDTNRYFGFYTNGSDGSGTELVRIAEDGNVAIQPGGATLTNTRLYVVSADNYNPSLYDGMGGIRIGSGGSSSAGDGNYTGGIGFAITSGTSGIAGVQKGADADKQGLAFFTHPSDTGGDAAVEKMRLDADGNVGIGTISPDTLLNIEGSSPILTIEDSRVSIGDGTIMGRIDFKQNDNSGSGTGVSGSIYSISSSATGQGSDLAFTTGVPGSTTEKMRIQSTTGNVGIGTTSPAAKLTIGDPGGATTRSIQIEGNTSTSGMNGVIGYFANALYISNNYYYNSAQVHPVSTLGQTNIACITGTTTGSNFIDLSVSDHTDSNNAPDVRMRIMDNGNVGIGTTSPGNKLTIASGTGGGSAPDSRTLLHIDKDGEAYISINSPAESFNGIRLNVAGSPKAFMELYDNTAQGKKLNIGTTDARDLVFDTGNQPKMTILSGGNVGIGTVSPSATTRLHIRNATSNSYATLRLEGSNRGGIIQMYNQTSYPVSSIQTDQSGNTYFSTSGAFASTTLSAKMTILTGGNVGIGTTSPNAPLDVLSLTSGSSGIQQWSYNTAPSSYRLQLNQIVSSGLVKYSFDQLNAGVGYNNVIVLDRGNVGIGTVAPQALLDVSKNNTTIYDPTDDLGQRAGTATIHIANQTATTNTFGQLMYDSRSSGQGIARIVFLNGGSATVGIAFVTEHSEVKSEKMRIQSNGNVGIGDTTPSYKLDVAGTIRATGDVIAYSDVRVKENIKTIDNSLEKVSKLRGVEFNKIGKDEKSIGVIAQEIEKVIPEVVHEDKDGMKSVAYGNITGVLIEAIKELKAEIEGLKNKPCACNNCNCKE